MDTPLVLGRLKRDSSGRCALLGHAGDVRAIPGDWFDTLSLMDGFHSMQEIAVLTGNDEAAVREIFQTLRGGKHVSTLQDWNVIYWCAACRTYLTRATACPGCGSSLKQVPWLPPCDPWILFEQEYEFVRQALRIHAGVEIDADRLLLGNNGICNNRFFWQIAYDGRIVLRIDFNGLNRSSWKVIVHEAAHEVNWRVPSQGRSAEALRMAAANQDSLQKIEADSIAFLDEVWGYYDTTPLMYFSGGKESMVMLRLLEKAGRKTNLAFVGTGLDFPEDARFLLEELKPEIDRNPIFDLRTNVAAEDMFLGAFELEGNRLDARSAWCRERIKVPLKRALTEEFYGDRHFVALEGSRWYENDFRRSHPGINFARGYDKQIWVHPIARWTGLDVWLYTYAEKLKVNPMYGMGYQRTTCWMCPIVNPFHLDLSKTQYPELWKKMANKELVGLDNVNPRSTPF